MTIAERLAERKSKGGKSLAGFATVGDPDIGTSLRVFEQLGNRGADILELGIPYSDPLMDGPVLQRSYLRALNRGFRLRELPQFIENVRKLTETPALIMTCYNPIHQYGVRRFFQDVSAAGADSVLITDLPPEEWGESLDLAKSFNLGTIFLVTPTTPVSRMEWINEISRPFVYCVTRMGVTGTGEDLPEALTSFVSFVRDVVTQPLMLGFGISNGRQAAAAGRMADGVIIGSAIVECVERNLESDERIIKSVANFIGGVRATMDDAAGEG
jgi:tryptophan synthase alpha chain